VRDLESIMEPICTPAAVADAPAILAMMREYYASDRIPFDPRVARPALETLLADPALGRVFLIRDHGDVAGYAVLTFDFGLESGGREAFIDEIFVRENRRGRGLGSAALRFLEESARAWGLKAVHLGVEIANTRAQALYRRAGYGAPTRYLMTRRIEAP
jgi:ribosomal protein S18 acetylase RimI-like enzyme